MVIFIKKMKASYKGIYKPSNPKKYLGDPNRIVYRSLLERRMMVYCDNNKDIVMWASEELSVPYWSPIDRKFHRYYPDFIVKTIKNKKYMIEVKPSSQCKPPKMPKRKNKSYLREQIEWVRNQSKWKAAIKYCEDNDLAFKIMTEKDLGVIKNT